LNQLAQIYKENRVYVDEWGIKEHLKREYGRTPRGVKAEDVKRGPAFYHVNIVAAVIYGNSCTERIAPMCYQKSMTGERFEHCMENNMLKCIGIGKTVIMDNAPFHRKKRLHKLARGKVRFNITYLYQ
jgi:hypothetical protein